MQVGTERAGGDALLWGLPIWHTMDGCLQIGRPRTIRYWREYQSMGSASEGPIPRPSVHVGGAHTSRQLGCMTRSGALAMFIMITFCCVLPGVLYVPPIAQGVPNPVTLEHVTYLPGQGPRSTILLDSRPENVAQAYVTDYIRLAGTYPCESDPNPYIDFRDPLLRTGRCDLVRPVASWSITSITIQSHGLFGVSDALVNVTVIYRDGGQWKGTIGLGPGKFQDFPPPLTTHLTCWESYGSLSLFGHLTPDIPPGAGYSVGDGDTYSPSFRCKP